MDIELLRGFIERYARLFVLTGAGCSTESGIPDYRDAQGNWKRPRPVTLQSFLTDPQVRRRYWARSLVGWRQLRRARPNGAHRALARLERCGRMELLLTQNVDGLHQAAGSDNVLDLHGRLDVVRCLGCGQSLPREQLQGELMRLNPGWKALQGSEAPDGDAELTPAQCARFAVPDCEQCGGVLKPDVVFFGENVPPQRVEFALRRLQRADAMLVIGSSLMVYSGFRFARAAAESGKPIAAVNLGRTRADELLALKLRLPCAPALGFLLEQPLRPTRAA